jgi:hypothetical protein
MAAALALISPAYHPLGKIGPRALQARETGIAIGATS